MGWWWVGLTVLGIALLGNLIASFVHYLAVYDEDDWLL
jgi:hypothetical protein